MQNDTLLSDVNGAVGWLTINREAKMNTLTREMWHLLTAKLQELCDDSRVRVIVIRGAGDQVFSAGADIEEMKIRLESSEAHDGLSATAEAFDAIADCTKPTIAMVHGHCFGGGCAIALGCDVRLVSDESLFAITPARLGLGYPYNGVERAVHELGASFARYMLITANRIKPDEALRVGLAHAVHPAGDLERETTNLAERMASLAPLTIRAARESLRVASHRATALDEVNQLIEECATSEDFREGARAFMEKRKPKFEGR